MTERSNRLIAGCGYLGYRVATTWQGQDIETHAITRRSSRAAEFETARILPVMLDLSQPSDSAAVPAADVVLWSVGFDRSSGVPREQVWLDGLRWLIESLTEAPSRFLYVSSTSVYGDGDGESVDETTPVNPVTEGGECCVRAEELLRDVFQSRFPQTALTVLRLAGIYGPGRLLRRITDLQNKTPVAGNPDQWLNLIHVDDAVRVIDRICELEDVPEVINVVNAGTLTRREYYSHLAHLVDAPAPVFENAAASNKLRRGGNRRVISRHRSLLDAALQFDDVRAGLADAVVRTNQGHS